MQPLWNWKSDEADAHGWGCWCVQRKTKSMYRKWVKILNLIVYQWAEVQCGPLSLNYYRAEQWSYLGLSLYSPNPLYNIVSFFLPLPLSFTWGTYTVSFISLYFVSSLITLLPILLQLPFIPLTLFLFPSSPLSLSAHHSHISFWVCDRCSNPSSWHTRPLHHLGYHS